MRRRSRLILVIAAGLAVLAALVVGVIHAPAVQDAAWRRAASEIERSTGWRVDAERVALRVFPARFAASGVAASNHGRTVLRLDAIEARWSWFGLLAKPRRIESLVIEGLTVDLDAMPTIETESEPSTLDPWQALEIASVRLSGGVVSGGALDVAVELDGLSLDGSLRGGRAEISAGAEKLTVWREARELDLGRLDLETSAGERGVALHRLSIVGPATAVVVDGEVTTADDASARLQVEVGADIRAAAGWWDPNLVSGLEPSGRVELSGPVVFSPTTGFEVDLRHHGGPLQIAGYELEGLRLVYSGGRPTVEVAGEKWGRASVEINTDGSADVQANLDRAPIDSLLAFAAPQLAQSLRGPTTLSGSLDGTVSFPVDVEALAGRVDLVLVWAEGRIAVAGEGSGRVWRVDRFEAEAMSARASGNGSIAADGSVRADLTLAVPRPQDLMEALRPWLPAADLPDVGGGRLDATGTVAGQFSDPLVTAAVRWDQPEVLGRKLLRSEISVDGSLALLRWSLDVEPAERSLVSAHGTARPMEPAVDGSWQFSVVDPAALIAGFAPDLGLEVHGVVEGEGTFSVSTEGQRLAGEVSGSSVGSGIWKVDSVRVSFEADPSSLVVRELAVEGFGGSLDGSMRIVLDDPDDELAAELQMRGLDLGRLPLELPEAAVGILDGGVRLGGSLARPQGDADVSWRSLAEAPLLERLGLRAELQDGLFSIDLEDAAAVTGRLSGAAEVPLGGLPKPAWLWPDAPGGVVHAQLAMDGFRSRPLLDAIGVEDPGAEIEADVRAEVVWDPHQPESPTVRLEASDLRVYHPSGDLVAEGPVVATFDGSRFELAPLVLVGLGSRIEAEAVYRPETEEVVARLRSKISAELARLAPIPLSVRGPITVAADIRIPARADATFAEAQGTITIDHGDGSLVMRDPPVEIRGLQLIATVRGGAVTGIDGSAEVNRGTVELGGGWDPQSGQGVVLEFDDVTFLTAGILTKWDGQLAVEPHPERLAMVVGDLTLVAGLWDENFGLAGALLGGDELELASDDPLYGIGLDLDVRGRTGIKVDNNLGQFDASWDVLRIGGTAAAPRLRGEVRIAAGGTLALGGREVKVRRGSLRFTGDPAVDPILEIVPESDMMLIGGTGESSGFDPTLAATRGLAQGLTSVLGVDNTTLRPAEIAVQTEKDPSTQFMVGQRLNRNLALFLATNLTDVQDRTTMLQAWNFTRLRGLVGQVFQETLNDDMGVNVLQRFRWGGTRDPDERPEIYSLRFDGDWPMSKRTLKGATRLRRGQPYDPFLLFVAAVRMERALAGSGYQEARVDASQEGEEMSPTLVFTCEPGPATPIEFVGWRPDAFLRREATALYRPPPIEQAGFTEIRNLLGRQLAVEGYPDAEVVVERRNGSVVVDIDRGEPLKLVGPVLIGVPLTGAAALGPALSSPAALAAMGRNAAWAAPAIERELAARGYHEARVASIDEVAVGDGTAEVRVTVDAGSREVVSAVVLTGDDPLGLVTPASFPVRAGDPLDRRAIDVAVHDLRGDYNEAGFREAAVRSSLARGDDGRWRVEVELQPGRQRTLREVRFAGQRDSSPKVLRKGMTIDVGGVVTDREIDVSASQVANFSPVERVEVRALPVGASQTDLEFDVVEKPRWILEAGAGWSTERGASGSFGVRDDNLFTRGVSMNLRGSWASNEQRILLVGALPPVPGGRISLISTIGYREGDAPDQPDLLAQEELLASLEAQYAMRGNSQIGAYYRWTDTRTFDKVFDPQNPIPSNTVRLGVLGTRLVVDRFDNLFDPRAGWAMTSDLGWSSQRVGSDFEYVSWLTNLSLALTPFRGATWVQTARVGVAEPLQGQNLIRDVRYFAGGQSSIRGFDLNSVGPLTFGVDFSLVPAGGGALFIINEELRVPVWGALRAAVFTDIGQVWESWRDADLELSVGAGVGLRWSTPIGPLWADVAWPVANVGISSTKPKFYLGIGRPF